MTSRNHWFQSLEPLSGWLPATVVTGCYSGPTSGSGPVGRPPPTKYCPRSTTVGGIRTVHVFEVLSVHGSVVVKLKISRPTQPRPGMDGFEDARLAELSSKSGLFGARVEERREEAPRGGGFWLVWTVWIVFTMRFFFRLLVLLKDHSRIPVDWTRLVGFLHQETSSLHQLADQKCPENCNQRGVCSPAGKCPLAIGR